MQDNLPQLSKLNANVLIPVFNDWDAVSLVLKNLDAAVDSFAIKGTNILLVDDASTHPMSESITSLDLKHIETIKVLRLTRNLGHQRAIAVGLVYLFQNDASDITVIMDGDGEDNPADIGKLLHAAVENGLQKIVFAERTIRSEGVVFYLFYQLYRTINRLLTGSKIRFGNFSAVPRKYLKSLVTVSELWNHYAASVVSSKIPYTLVQTARKKRYSGQSKMNFIGLVTHGLSAIAVQREVVGTRILMSITIGAIISLTVLSSVAFSNGAQSQGLPMLLLGICIVIVLLVQMLSIVLSLVFMVLGNRDSMTFLPLRDCGYFIEKVDCVQFIGNRHDQ
jgi:polyisoprenyl-phosphate glycosyltransferase